jgi:hypothetical protein
MLENCELLSALVMLARGDQLQARANTQIPGAIKSE